MASPAIVEERAYWLGLWLEWAPIDRYVVRPVSKAGDTTPLADFWVQVRDQEILIDGRAGQIARPKVERCTSPWKLETQGFVKGENCPSFVNDEWVWSRRLLLLNLERAHPFAVSSHLRGGLKATSRSIIRQCGESEISLGQLRSMADVDAHVALAAIFGLVRTHKMLIDWNRPLSLQTKVRVAFDAS